MAMETSAITDQHKGYECPDCQTRFSFRTNLNRHIRTVHNKDTVRVRTSCKFPGCTAKFYHQTKLLNHLETAHGQTTDKVEVSFPNMEEFLSWKVQEEAANYVSFTKQRGDISHMTVTHQHYVCQRDGSSRIHSSKNQPERKTGRKQKKGVIKTDLVCPARMLVRQCKKTGKVSVTYYKSHSHSVSSVDIVHHPLPSSTRTEIKKRLKAGASANQVFQECQSCSAVQLLTSGIPDSRLLRINRPQIRAMQRRMEVNEKAVERETHSQSLMQIVGSLSDGSNSGNDQFRGLEDGPHTEEGNDSGVRQEMIYMEPVVPSASASVSSDSDYGKRLHAMLSEIVTLMNNENVRKTMLPYVMGNLEEMLAICRQEASSKLR